MVRIHGALLAEPAGRLERELTALFGRALVELATSTDPADLDLSAELMDAVHNAADGLLASAGDPCAQRATVAALEPRTRLVLCMWLQDLGLAAKLTAEVIRGAA